MNADCKGALQNINKSWKCFVHRGKSMSKKQVKSVLEYAVKKGYDHTGILKDEEIDKILLSIKHN
jgi:hypothetical protein